MLLMLAMIILVALGFLCWGKIDLALADDIDGPAILEATGYAALYAVAVLIVYVTWVAT